MEAVIPWSPAETRVSTIDDASRVGEARRTAGITARALGFSEEEEGRVALVVTELGTNLVKHAGHGSLLLRTLLEGGTAGVEVIAIDRGPGIADVGASLRDGYSTARTAGNGLGAVRRLATEFDIYSRAPSGTVVVARIWKAGARPRAPLAVGAVCVPHPGEAVAGDDWDVRETAAGCRVMVADGLGHGPLAREAAQTALSIFRTGGDAPPARALEECHAALRATRGAAVALAEVDVRGGSVRYAGVGNVAAALFEGADVQRMVSLNGTLGLGAVRAREFTYRWPAEAVLVMSSDGLNTRWTLADHPGLAARDPSVIAGVLYRDHARGRDDATVVAVKARAA
jgi:anti-sigma regulatory factor (Ser/Thr protein kinase)